MKCWIYSDQIGNESTATTTAIGNESTANWSITATSKRVKSKQTEIQNYLYLLYTHKLFFSFLVLVRIKKKID